MCLISPRIWNDFHLCEGQIKDLYMNKRKSEFEMLEEFFHWLEDALYATSLSNLSFCLFFSLFILIV